MAHYSGLKQWPKRDLADEYAVVNAQYNALKKRREELSKEIKRRSGDHFVGRQFELKLTHSTQLRIDTALLAEKYGDDWMDEHSKTIPVTYINVKELPAAKRKPVETAAQGTG